MNIRCATRSLRAAALLTTTALIPGALAAQEPVDRPVPSVEQDRQAILAMAGTYAVTFSFLETVALADGYELKPEKLSEAHEVVRVIHDSGDRISLQHILVVQGGPTAMPVKHWRQDWIFEPEAVFDYVGDNTFQRRELSHEERAGKWAQFVYQVDDSPRYAAVAAWSHDHGVSTWEAPEAWRPLPRREATTRDDYDVMVARNRHVITPSGWVHEQDNSKLVTGIEPRYLAREVGVNTYVRSDDFQFAVADEYWAETRDFWAEVRAMWSEIEDGYERYGIALEGETTGLYGPVLTLADEFGAHEVELVDAVARAQDVVDQYVFAELARN